MTPIAQTRFGKQGNCWPACLATYFDVPLEEVDQCAGHHADWRERTDEFLAARGLFYVEFDLRRGGFAALSAIPDGTLVLGGLLSETSLNHAVVCRVVHEPVHDLPAGQVAYTINIIHDPLTFPDLRPHYELQTVILFCDLRTFTPAAPRFLEHDDSSYV